MIINQSDRMLLMMTMMERERERERERREGVHEKVTCSFMPIAETKAENHPWMLMQQLV
jgi:hypothetical protein